MSESHIEIGAGYTAYVGPDSTKLFTAITLKHGLLMLQKGIIPSRGWTKTRALSWCKEYTGKNYKRTQIDLAVSDLDLWINAMKCAIPMERRP